MDPISAAAVLSGVGGVVGSLFGELLAAGDEEAINRLLQQSLDETGSISLPKLEDIVARQQSGTETRAALDNADPTLRQAQLGALSRLEQVGQGGMTGADRGALNEARGAAGQFANGQRDAIEQEMQARGAMDSGNALVAQMMGTQGAAEQLSGSADRVAQTAADRALRAVEETGQLGGSIRGQDFSQQFAVGQSQDAINSFNTKLLSDADRFNSNLEQQRFDNRMARQHEKNTLRGAQMDRYAQSAQRKRAMGYAGGSAAGAGAGYYFGKKQETP